jgi:hypothetical protein
VSRYRISANPHRALRYFILAIAALAAFAFLIRAAGMA